MDVNGENTVKKWPRGIHALALTIVAPWPLDVLSVNRLVIQLYL